MAEDKADLFAQYQHITNKLRKKRIMKKPNVAEASQQFEELGINFERDELQHYAGLCYQAAAKCQNSLGNNLEEILLLLKSSRQFMSSYLNDLNDNCVPNESYLHHSLMFYKNCLTRLSECEDLSKVVKDPLTGSIIFEMAENLSEKANLVEVGSREYEKALKFYSDSPVEKINCLQKIVSTKIELGDYRESLKLVNDIVEEAKLLPDSGLKEDVLNNSEITRIFLLLILQPTPQQISPAAASALEKYAWVETSGSNDVKDLSATINDKGLSMLSEDLFLKLQSLVMACQYSDIESLELLESELMEHLSNEQKSLLQILIKQYRT